MTDGSAATPPVVAVAVSGGRDSLCLLHATLAAASALGVRVVALHVHHGLQPEADAWADTVVARCEAWAREGRDVVCRVARLLGAPEAGESVEAWARRERYAALTRLAREAGATLVLLGHHRRDQAETVLLQALRGAGAAGLAAMPAQAMRGGLAWARPWLDVDDAAVDAYAAAHGLADLAVHDPSNTHPRYARSRLRRDVMPALRAAFPDAEASLAAVATRAAEARALADEVSAMDLAALGVAGAMPLPHRAWSALSGARRANALRAWLAASLDAPVPETLVQRLLGEWRGGSGAAWPAGGDRVLRAWRGALVVAEGPSSRDGSAVVDRVALLATGPGRFALAGWSGHLHVEPAEVHGLPAAGPLRLEARARAGGERFALSAGGLARSLKKQYQAADVPDWARGGPLLWAGDRLVFVPGLGVDARAWAPAGTPQWRLRWEPDAPPLRAQQTIG